MPCRLRWPRGGSGPAVPEKVEDHDEPRAPDPVSLAEGHQPGGAEPPWGGFANLSVAEFLATLPAWCRRCYGNPETCGCRADRNERENTPLAATGTGFVIDDDGLILTNNHVVENATRIQIQFYGDDERYEARVLGRDRLTDSALLELGRAARPEAARGQVRRLQPDGAGRLGDGHRRALRPQPHGHRRGHLGARPTAAAGAGPYERVELARFRGQFNACPGPISQRSCSLGWRPA